MLAIVIPVKNQQWLDEFIEGNKEILEKYPVIVVDSGGGEKLEKFAKIYIKQDVSFWEARQMGYRHVSERYILNLDSDVVITKSYIMSALAILEAFENVGAVSVFYDKINRNRGVLEYGCSIWRTELLRELYDYVPKVGRICECVYMWNKLQNAGYLIETLCFRAKHLRDE